MRKLGIFFASLLAGYPSISLAQADPDFSRRELERMQAQQERWDAQVERQRAEDERARARQSGGGSGCALCNIISIFDGLAKKRHSKAAGQMLAGGDCLGAERYALSKGDFDLGAEVKEHCGRRAVRDPGLTTAVNWLKIEAEPDGTAYFVDRQSIRRVGDRYAWWMHVIYPAASDKRKISVLSLYRCSDRRNAVKTFVSYLRDGSVQLHTIQDRDLKFEVLDVKTAAEKGLVDEVCLNG